MFAAQRRATSFAAVMLLASMTTQSHAQITKAYRAQVLDLHARDLDNTSNTVLGLKDGWTHVQFPGRSTSERVILLGGYTGFEDPRSIKNGRISGQLTLSWTDDFIPGFSHELGSDYTETFLWDEFDTSLVASGIGQYGSTAGSQFIDGVQVGFVQELYGRIRRVEPLGGSLSASRTVDANNTFMATGWAEMFPGGSKYPWRSEVANTTSTLINIGDFMHNTVPEAINDQGYIVGYQDKDGVRNAIFIGTDNAVQLAWPLGVANDINNDGVIVGTQKNRPCAFLRSTNGSFTRIAYFTVNAGQLPKFTLDSFMKVNENGAILAKGTTTVNNNTVEKFFLLTPY